jgi:hypothetical protein
MCAHLCARVTATPHAHCHAGRTYRFYAGEPVFQFGGAVPCCACALPVPLPARVRVIDLRYRNSLVLPVCLHFLLSHLAHVSFARQRA